MWKIRRRGYFRLLLFDREAEYLIQKPVKELVDTYKKAQPYNLSFITNVAGAGSVVVLASGSSVVSVCWLVFVCGGHVRWEPGRWCSGAGVLSTEKSKTDEELLEMSRTWNIVGVDLISGVSCTAPYEWVDKTGSDWEFLN
ncbi:hypothetical protein IFM89_004391 [Coptis chinensis]|uniref:Uncharacterized protein n=1 Tax=Coptis chinensis TaxID=261450 RepID=A0A835HZN0_9MAGN|nr:hypothetical protein IFM89_004391 [Coptis chinensis]